MKAIILGALLATLWSPTWANSSQVTTRVQGTTCTNCTPDRGAADQQVRDVRNAITSQMSVAELAQVNQVMNFARTCSSFVTANGLGPWGQAVVSEMRSKNYQALYDGTSDLRQACPGYNSLNSNSKELVWVMIINAMAHLESSCNPSVGAKGPNGSLIGLLQLHNGREQIYSQGCRRGDGKTGTNNVRCGLAMLNRQIMNDENLFSRRSYWDVLRPQARSQKYRKVRQAIAHLPVCK